MADTSISKLQPGCGTNCTGQGGQGRRGVTRRSVKPKTKLKKVKRKKATSGEQIINEEKDVTGARDNGLSCIYFYNTRSFAPFLLSINSLISKTLSLMA